METGCQRGGLQTIILFKFQSLIETLISLQGVMSCTECKNKLQVRISADDVSYFLKLPIQVKLSYVYVHSNLMFRHEHKVPNPDLKY